MSALIRLLRFLRPYWVFALVAPIFTMTEVALDLQQPRLVRHIIDFGIARSDLHEVLHTGGKMMALLLIGMACGIGCTFFAVRAAYGLGGDLRRAVFEKVQKLSFGNLDQLETGALITRLTSDVNQVQEMATMLLRGMIRMPLLLAGSLCMAVITSPQLGVILFAVLPAMIIALVLIVRKTFPAYRAVQTQLDGLNTVLQENLAGVRVVKAFARHERETERFARANDGLIRQMVNAVRAGARTSPAMMLTLNSGIAAALWIGGNAVYRGTMQVGEVVAFISYLMQSLMSLLLFSNLLIQASRAQASARRIAALLDTEPSIDAYVSAAKGHRVEGRIEFRNVSFRYNPKSPDAVLKGISFVAEPGQTVAFLGATGAGKSTLAQLIPRFYDVTGGRITIDDIDVREYAEEDLRRQISIALQESILFSATIRENIAMGAPNASFEEIVAAAKRAQADEFIRRLPEGYETVVGQRGVNLSGGQKQRLAIARALLPQTPILILDDSTSAVDVHTEARIHEAFQALPYRQTRIVVAQRISTVMTADKILVIDDGQIVGAGSHAELLETNPVYREIYESQTENGVLVHGGE